MILAHCSSHVPPIHCPSKILNRLSKTMHSAACLRKKKEKLFPSPYMHTASIWGEGKFCLDREFYKNAPSILHFTKGKGEFQEGEQVWPCQGYRWDRADPRISPGPADPGNSGKFREKSGKTGKFRKIQNIACDPSN